jgi:hypothetical protein
MLAVLALQEANMAARYFGLDRADENGYVAEGSSTTSKEIEVVIATTGTVTKADALRLLNKIAQHILESTDNLVA